MYGISILLPPIIVKTHIAGELAAYRFMNSLLTVVKVIDELSRISVGSMIP
jgi:hypothetical protein